MTTASLIFGEVGIGSPAACRDICFGIEAYERFQLPHYLQEIIRIRTDPDFICGWGNFECLFYAFDLLGSDTFFEIGSTLFASIDKFEKCRRLAGRSDELRDVQFYGVEPSNLLRQTAEILHTGMEIRHIDDHELPAGCQKPTGRSYQSTSYAFATTASLVAWIAGLEFSHHGIWFSSTGGEEHYDAFGNEVTLFDYDDFVRRLGAAGCTVIVTSAQQVAHYNFSCTEVWMFCHRMGNEQAAELEELCDASKFGSGRNLDLRTAAESRLSDLPESIWKTQRDVSMSSGNAWTSLANRRFLDFTNPQTRADFDEYMKTHEAE